MEYISLSWPKSGLIIYHHAVISSLLTSVSVRAAPAANTLQYREYRPRLLEYTKAERIAKMKEVEGRIQDTGKDLQGAATKVHAGEVYLSIQSSVGRERQKSRLTS
jgi:hypothetical protein